MRKFKSWKSLRDNATSTGSSAHSLAFAKVVRVDYESHTVQLYVLLGDNGYYLRDPIPISYPGAGPRHFMGAMPTEGSYCVIGHLPSKPAKTPVVLAWNVPNPWLGHDWVVTQEHRPTEFDMNPRMQAELEGITARMRHKLRHMTPGTLLLSSEPGSDIVVDAGILLTNRRGDEIRMREQDQALIFKSLQQFHATGGTRSYVGMVQRDATLLPTALISDGKRWDGPVQTVQGAPLSEGLLETDPVYAEGVLQPHRAFSKMDPAGAFPDSGYLTPPSVDPYNLLHRGLFIGADGVVVNPSQTLSEAEYHGKSIFRVAASTDPDSGGRPLNAAIDADAETLVEHRIELNHTWDGRLPVTEQTDGFDMDRLPPNTEGGSALSTGDRPFIQWVLGSVVGNDPFSETGRVQYGQPLAPNVFDADGSLRPSMDVALGLPLAEHAASLFRVESPTDINALPMFASITKDGRFKGYLGGSPLENSLELATAGGVKVQAGGPLDLRSSSPLKLSASGAEDPENLGFCFDSPTGAICLRAGGATTRGSATARNTPSSIEEAALPGLMLEAPTSSVQIQAARNVRIQGGSSIQLANSQRVDITPQNLCNILTDKFSTQCTTGDKTVLAKETVLYSGPKNFNPANAPLRSVTFGANPLTGHFGGPTDAYRMVFGDRNETFLVGNHSTNVLVGSITWRTGVGSFTAQAGINTLNLNTGTGISAAALLGPLSLFSSTTASLRGLGAVTVSTLGVARLSGATTILGGTGAVGGIVNGSDIDPLSGLPMAFLGLGSPGHLLGPPVP